MIKVLFLSSEAAPFVKTGGLADVAGSLPLALGALDIEVLVMIPRYRGIEARDKKLADNVRIHFVDHEAYYNRSGLYGNEGGDYPDNLERFSFFCRESLAASKQKGFKPDIVHLNDWQTALTAVLLKIKLKDDPFFKNTRTLLTVHNLAFQGQFPEKKFAELGLDESLYSPDAFEFYGKVNLLKAGLIFADALNTVSPTYAKEILTEEYGAGLDGVLKQRANRLRGILNGLDTNVWDPSGDPRIKKKYSADKMDGKAACKQHLQESCSLEAAPDVPVFGVVSRLAEQKGLDLIAEMADEFLEKRVQFVLLGEGDGVYHTTFRNIAARHPKNTDMNIGFDAEEAHKVYAGCDFFLMPSYFEPCGLGQLIALRYGTIPIVRRTGGLADTVIDVDTDVRHGNGFVFESRTGSALLKTVERALAAYADKKRFHALRTHGMKADYSWQRSASEYKKYYKEIHSL